MLTNRTESRSRESNWSVTFNDLQTVNYCVLFVRQNSLGSCLLGDFSNQPGPIATKSYQRVVRLTLHLACSWPESGSMVSSIPARPDDSDFLEPAQNNRLRRDSSQIHALSLVRNKSSAK